MNVKPGDLAIIKKPKFKEDAAFEGQIIKITKLSSITNSFNDPCWEYELPELIASNGKKARCFPDCLLRRIENPPDDAVDEVIQRIGSPNKQEQTA